MRLATSNWAPAVFAALWGLKLMAAFDYDPDSGKHPALLYAGLAFELLLSVFNGIEVEALLAAIELRAPSLASWFETLFAVLQQTARVVFVRAIHADDDQSLLAGWLAVTCVAAVAGRAGSRLFPWSTAPAGARPSVVAVTTIAVAWACSNAVMDGLWNVAKKRRALVAAEIDTMVFTVAVSKFAASVVAIAVQARDQKLAVATLRRAPTTRLAALVVANGAPLTIYAALLAFNHRGLEGYLGAAFVARLMLDCSLDHFGTPTLGPLRMQRYAVVAVLLSIASAALLYFDGAASSSDGFGGTATLPFAGLLLAIIIDRCNDAAAVFIGGPIVRSVQRPLFSLFAYWLKARFSVSRLRSALDDDPNAVTAVLMANFAGTEAAVGFGCAAAAWAWLGCSFRTDTDAAPADVTAATLSKKAA